MVRNGFSKWLNSTKFQICVLGMILLYMAPVFFETDPTRAAEFIRDMVLGYMGFRATEPIVEAAVNGIGAWWKKRNESPDTEGD